MSNVTGMLAGVGLLSVCCISSSLAAGAMGGSNETPTPTSPTPTSPTPHVCTTKTSSTTCGPEPHCWWSDADSKCYEICYNTDLKCGNTIPRNDDGTCKYEGKLCVSQNCENKGTNKSGITNPC